MASYPYPYYIQSAKRADKFIAGIGRTEDEDKRPRAGVHVSASDKMGMDHAMKRYKYFEDLRQPIPTFALTEYSKAVEDRVQSQVQAYAQHGYETDPSGGFPASSIEGGEVDTSRVPLLVYFPAKLRNGRYELSSNYANLFGTLGEGALPYVGLSGGKKRSRKHKRSHRKKSHRKKSGKKSHRKSRRH